MTRGKLSDEPKASQIGQQAHGNAIHAKVTFWTIPESGASNQAWTRYGQWLKHVFAWWPKKYGVPSDRSKKQELHRHFTFRRRKEKFKARRRRSICGLDEGRMV
ncbi:hypothetical protein CVT26_001539 [Gymnopilus dilepis]|uniref:Uncharacterized protein n=1 Tax=Gymnopilus dilepis TaxID=231916 RepID=A0A409VTS0_9AGAR|nr:hypothetical protein CVT26_001539 [Gymnopilus dilepis]